MTPSPGTGQTPDQAALFNTLAQIGLGTANAFQGPYRGYGVRDLLPRNPFYQGAQFPQFNQQTFQNDLQQGWGMNSLNQAFQPMQFPIPGKPQQPPAPPANLPPKGGGVGG